MMKPFALALLATLATPALAPADPVQMRAPYVAASLHQGTLNLVAYYRQVGDLAEVTATYVSRSGATAPAKVVLLLADGEQTSFGLPGHPGSLFQFVREGDYVSVEHIVPNQITVAAR